MTLAIPSRRRFLLGAGALLAAPSIVRVSSLMPVSVLASDLTWLSEGQIYRFKGQILAHAVPGEVLGRRVSAFVAVRWMPYAFTQKESPGSKAGA